MRQLILSIALLFLAHFSYSQIMATTSSGKKVVLNMNGTWHYADGPSVQEKPCQLNHTGNLTVENSTDTAVYFYYTRSGIFSKERDFIKLKPKSSKTIENLESSDQNITYNWTATYELQDTRITWDRVSGIEKGTFVIVACEVAEIEIN